MTKLIFKGRHLTNKNNRDHYIRNIWDFIHWNFHNSHKSFIRFLHNCSNSKFISLYKELHKLQRQKDKSESQMMSLNKILVTEINYEEIDTHYYYLLKELCKKYNFKL